MPGRPDAEHHGALAQEVSVPQAVRAALPQDMSIGGMIANADWVVKAIIATLAVASVMTWTVALAKGIEFHSAEAAWRFRLRRILSSPCGSPKRRIKRSAGRPPAAYPIDLASSATRRVCLAWGMIDQINKSLPLTQRGTPRLTHPISHAGGPLLGDRRKMRRFA
jgi:hypothetical protein